ncbi:MAG: IS630 family transposase [Bacteroidota bacterium]|nr:IS630 family transposase [Bacteroidota bacterium]
MPALPFNLSEAEIERLRYERYAYPQPMIQKRIFAVYLKGVSTFSNQDIGFICGLHANTVAHWMGVYQQQGYEGLLSIHYGTNESELEQYSESLLASFQEQPPRSAGEAAERIRQMSGVERSTQQVRVFMKRHGLKFLKCGHVPAKANSEAQHKWVEDKLRPAIEAAKQGKIHLLFLDAAHFVLQPFLCCLWCVVRIFIRATSGRNRINVLGAVHALTQKIVTMTNTTYLTADTLIEFLQLLKKKFCDKPLVVVLDNARYQHCAVVKAVAEKLNITLLFLPPYSPNLNIIERLWKFTKKKILYAKYYDQPKAFHAAIENFFKDVSKKYKSELKSLLTLKFQFFDEKNSLIYPL